MSDASACVYCRPFRLSCIAFVMMFNTSSLSREGPTIASVYHGSNGNASVRKWIEKNRNDKEGNTEELLSSDDSERRFLAAIRAGAQITRRQVGLWVLFYGTNANWGTRVTCDLNLPDPRWSYLCIYPNVDTVYVRLWFEDAEYPRRVLADDGARYSRHAPFPACRGTACEQPRWSTRSWGTLSTSILRSCPPSKNRWLEVGLES